MKSKIKIIVLVSCLYLTLNSCLNKYEKEVIGNYELYKYESIDTNQVVDEFTKLIIKKDKSFEIKFENKTIIGKWNADDYGDWTLIQLENNGKLIKGRILGNSILFEGVKFKEFENFKSIEFTKTIIKEKLNSLKNINELSKIEFDKTFSKKMIDVTETAEPIVNIWEYGKVLYDQNLIPQIVYKKELVEFVYRNSENTYEHILLPTSENNIFIIIVVNIIEEKIEGHYKMNINKEYSIK